MSVYIIQNNILQCKIVIQKIFWTVFLNANKKDALCFATKIWKLLDMLKLLSSINGIKLMIILLLIVFS